MDNTNIICDCQVIHEDVVNAVKEKMPDDLEFQRLANFFKVFSDMTRTRIIWALFEQEMCVCDIAVLLNMTKSAVSHQLSFLRANNLVNYRKTGKVVFYSLADFHIKQIFNAGREHINE